MTRRLQQIKQRLAQRHKPHLTREETDKLVCLRCGGLTDSLNCGMCPACYQTWKERPKK